MLPPAAAVRAAACAWRPLGCSAALEARLETEENARKARLAVARRLAFAANPCSGAQPVDVAPASMLTGDRQSGNGLDVCHVRAVWKRWTWKVSKVTDASRTLV